GGTRGGFRLDTRVLTKARTGLLRLGKSERARVDRFDAIGLQQLAHFRELACIVSRDDQRTGDLPVHGAHITAIFCRSTSLPTPLRARARSAANSSSVNGVFSAVACTSTRRPSPVMTKFASVSASESSA